MKPKLCLVIPIWQRPMLTNHLLTYYHQLKVAQADVQLVVVGSEGERSRRIARGLHYLEVENEPLDRKYDAGIEYCRSLAPDAVCLVGSDDFITEPYFSWGITQLSGTTDMVGLLDFYLVDLPQQRVQYWGGYKNARSGESIAAGRMYSPRLLERLNWKPYWSSAGYQHTLRDDERAWQQALSAKARVRSINMAYLGCRYWAVKSGNEINPTTAFEKAYSLIDISPHSWSSFSTEVGLST